jgi:hypothetical protein
MNARHHPKLSAAALAAAAALVLAGTASAAAPGLVASYSFDETAGAVAVDGSARGAAGRLSGARRTAAGRYGGAVAFDGRGDVVTVRGGRPRAIRRAMTLEAWVRPAAARRRGWTPVIAAGPRRRPAYALYAGPGARALVRTRGRSRPALATSTRRVRGWTHLAATYDGRRLAVYLDGARVARRAARGALAAGRGPLRIGGSFTGTIDEVRLYSRALSAAEIRADMAAGAAPGAGEPGGPAPSAPYTELPPGAPVPIYDGANPPRTPTVDELPKRSSVTKDGITWTFSRAMPIGQFITGDYYVVGAATVTAISPAPANGRNGSVKNLPPVDDETGFDSRTDANRYDAGLRSDPPVNLAPGDSLVSSISVDAVGATRRWLFDKASGSPVKTISVLTVLAAPQPPDAFRPSYVGRGAPVYLSRNLRRELLPRFAKVADTPSLAEYTDHFRRPWVDSMMFNFDDPIEYMPDYSREIARAVGIAGLLLSLDYTPQEKESLLVYLTQYGIDLDGLVEAGHPGWSAHGGHGSGRKFPIVLAGTLLGQPGMQRPPGRFGEDMQTMAGPSWTGASYVYAGHYGPSGTGEFGPYEHLQPSQWPGTLGEDYRRCCTSSAWIGEALAARLIGGVQLAWNHAPFFGYADRWMTEDDTQHRATIQAQIGKNYNGFPQRKAWDRFVTNMWAARR